jgi:glycosyltransferase involved in cell wall biosynthesis
VTSNAGGLPEVNIHGETGFLENVGDVDAMTTDTLKILTDDTLRRALAANARQRVLDNFTTDRIVQRYLEHYQNVLEGRE